LVDSYRNKLRDCRKCGIISKKRKRSQDDEEIESEEDAESNFHGTHIYIYTHTHARTHAHTYTHTTHAHDARTHEREGGEIIHNRQMHINRGFFRKYHLKL